MTVIALDMADYRRAVAAMRHAANDDFEGIVTIFNEATPRPLEFLYAVLDVHRMMLAAAYDDHGAHDVLNEWAMRIAAQEAGEAA